MAGSQPGPPSLVRSRVANWEQQRDVSPSTSPALSSSPITVRRDVSTGSNTNHRLAFPTTINNRASNSSDRGHRAPTTTREEQSSAALLAGLPAYARQPEPAPFAASAMNGGDQAASSTEGVGGDFASLTPHSLLWAQVRATTAWRDDLQNLYKRSSERFADVCWTTDRNEAGLLPSSAVQSNSAESSEEELSEYEDEE